MASGLIDEDQLTDGFMFDGSSIAGWKAINESDMILKPDLDAAYVDPFSATPMLVLFCNVVEPSTGELYGRDPRSTATRAEAYLKATGIGDTVYVGPEAEFFMFDDVRFEDGYNVSSYRIDDIELPTNTAREYDGGNLGHRPRAKGGYFPVAPVDSAMDGLPARISLATKARKPGVSQEQPRPIRTVSNRLPDPRGVVKGGELAEPRTASKCELTHPRRDTVPPTLWRTTDE